MKFTSREASFILAHAIYFVKTKKAVHGFYHTQLLCFLDGYASSPSGYTVRSLFPLDSAAEYNQNCHGKHRFLNAPAIHHKSCNNRGSQNDNRVYRQNIACSLRRPADRHQIIGNMRRDAGCQSTDQHHSANDVPYAISVFIRLLFSKVPSQIAFTMPMRLVLKWKNGRSGSA